MILIDNFKNVLMNKYATFEGRASRSEYWLFGLGFFIIFVVIGIIDYIIFGDESGLLTGMLSLLFLLPEFGLVIRRLHDIGKSGWWCLLSLIPFIGPLVLIIFYVMDSQPGTNKYGPNPKGVNTSGGSSGSTGSATYDTTATVAPTPAPSAPESTPVPDPLVHGDSNSSPTV